ncbi:MAG: hypothetical protein GYB32_07765 [Algicola sp.]|nr:hypothetical protein [Algicola sp.]
MLIVIIISSVVIGLAFTTLSLIRKNMWAIQNNLKYKTELNRLEQSLWIDFNHFSELSYSQKEEELKFNSPMDSCKYKFKTDMVIKEQDTFQIRFDQKQFYFGGNVTIHGKVDAIKLEIVNKAQEQHLFVFKRNDAEQYLN